MIRNIEFQPSSNQPSLNNVLLRKEQEQRRLASPASQPHTILIEKGKLRVEIPVQNILFVKAEHVYSRIFFINNQQVLQRISLKKLLGQLPKDTFLRVHRSFLVNVDHVRKFNSTKVLIREAAIPIGRTWRGLVIPELRELKAK